MKRLLLLSLLLPVFASANQITPTVLATDPASNLFHAWTFADFDPSMGELTGVLLHASAQVGLHVAGPIPYNNGYNGGYIDGYAGLSTFAGNDPWSGSDVDGMPVRARITRSFSEPVDLLANLTVDMTVHENLAKYEDGGTWRFAVGDGWDNSPFSGYGYGASPMIAGLAIDVEYLFEPVQAALSRASIPVTPNPEPGYWALMGVGMVGLAWKKKHAG